MVLGILGLGCFPVGILALILGIVALGRTGTPGADKGRGFAITGTVLGGVSILLTPLLLAIFLPALGAARRTARRMQNSTQIRQIDQGLHLYATTNKGNYPGLTARGMVVMDGSATGNSGDGDAPAARAWVLVNGQFAMPDMFISPSETKGIAPYPGSGPMTKDQLSYAMLSFKKTGSPQANAYRVDSGSTARANSWSDSTSAMSILISDRNTGSDPFAGLQSLHTHKVGEWRGSVLWGDGSVMFEKQPVFETKYANGSLNRMPPGDHLFIDEPASATNSVPGANALMVHDKP